MLGTFIVYDFLSGIEMALGWISWSTPFFTFVAFAPLWYIMYRVEKDNYRRPYLLVGGMCLLFFSVWNAMATWWLVNATWGGFFIAFGYNVVAMTLIMLLSYFVARRKGYVVGVIFWIALWLSFEKMHLEWELAWPWLNIGNAFANYPQLVQWYEYTGTLGGSLWVMIAGAMFFYLWIAYDAGERGRSLYIKAGAAAGVVVVPVVLSLAVGAMAPSTAYSMEAVALQPNIDPYEEKYSMNDDAATDMIIDMADSVLLPSTRLVVAPETFLPDYKDFTRAYDYPQYDRLKEYSIRHDSITIVTGASYLKRYYSEQCPTPTAHRSGRGMWYDLYNVAVQITPSEYDVYQKSKLVPGVESFPYRSVMEPLLGNTVMDFGGMVGSVVTQEDRSVFVSHGDSLRLAPVICYESVFGEFVTGYVKRGANVICVITNDAWWGDTEGHRQHLSYARLRAIETRTPVIRSANTGISAFIDVKGNITASQYYNSQKALVGKINIANAPETFYVRYGDYIAIPMPYVALLWFIYSLIPLRRKK